MLTPRPAHHPANLGVLRGTTPQIGVLRGTTPQTGVLRGAGGSAAALERQPGVDLLRLPGLADPRVLGVVADQPLALLPGPAMTLR